MPEICISHDLIVSKLGLIRCAARAVKRKYPSALELGDLCGWGIVAAYMAVESYGPELSDALLAGCVRNAMLSTLRKEWPEEHAELTAEPTAAPHSNTGELLEGLSERDKRILQDWSEGATEAEIASGLGISQQAVSRRKRKAIARLRNGRKALAA